MAKIGWIGLGNMGCPMSKNLIKAGYELVVWDLFKTEKALSVVEMGAQWSENSKEVGKESDILFTSLPNGDAFKSVIIGENGALEGMKEGGIIVDMSTISPEDSATVSNEAEKKNIRLLRAPVTGSTILAEKAQLGILVSGDRDTYEKVLPIFEKLGNKYFYLGGDEQARVMKIAINMMIATTMQMESEAVVLAEKAGIDVRQAVDLIADSAAGSPLTKYKADLIADGEYDPAFSVRLMMKDLDLALAAGHMYGVPMPSTALTRQMLQSAAATGRSEKDFSVLIQCAEEQAGYKR